MLQRINGLQWMADFDSGINNAPNSHLLVGPVNMTLHRSSYQCMFSFAREGGLVTVVSNVGTMTVVGMYVTQPHRHCNNTLKNCN